MDVGTSGGVFGLERGYCLMIGGEAEIVRRLEPIFETLAPAIGGGDAHARQGAAIRAAASADSSIAVRTAPDIS